MTAVHSFVQACVARPQIAYPRFVAVLDVLGMKSWLEIESPQVVAEQLDQALAYCEQASSGVTHEGLSYGPLLGSTFFSDSLLVWAPDDSWTSLATMCGAVKMIVAVALRFGVPLRGSISVGDVVCNARELRFVGPAIADAFLWAEKRRPYRSVGVDITPATIEKLRAKLDIDPLPNCWNCWLTGIPADVLRGVATASQTLIWFRECLIVNHWAHGMFLAHDPRVLFVARKIKMDDGANHKLLEMTEFLDAWRRVQFDSLGTDHQYENQKAAEQFARYAALDSLRTQRAPF